MLHMFRALVRFDLLLKLAHLFTKIGQDDVCQSSFFSLGQRVISLHIASLVVVEPSWMEWGAIRSAIFS